jgi:hypothetical protein
MAQRLQVQRSQTPLWILAGLLFITLGDYIPGPIGKTSLQLRTQIENTLTGVQLSRPKNNPYSRTEQQLERLEKK